MNIEKRPSPEAAPQYRGLSKLEVGIRTLTGNYRPHGSLQEADSILCLAMGYRVEQNICGEDIITPGTINDSLAAYIYNLGFDVLLFSQFEVDDALGGIAEARSGSPDIWLRGDSHDTEDVVSELTPKMDEAGVRHPLIVA